MKKGREMMGVEAWSEYIMDRATITERTSGRGWVWRCGLNKLWIGHYLLNGLVGGDSDGGVV
jgi:hypothetical protein